MAKRKLKDAEVSTPTTPTKKPRGAPEAADTAALKATRRSPRKTAVQTSIPVAGRLEAKNSSGSQTKRPAAKVLGKNGSSSNSHSVEAIQEPTSKAIDSVDLAPQNESKPVKAKRKSKEEKAQETMPLASRSQAIKHHIGAHVSIAKGVQNSVLNALHIGGNAFALFLKSQRKWESPPMQEEHATLFHGLCKDHGYNHDHIVPHGSYLVNLASVNPEQRQKSLTSFLDDMKRCSRLGITLYNFHPGNTNGASREEACARIAEAINEAHEHVPGVTPLLETMASNKPTSNVVGGKFEDLASIISGVKDKSRVGVCVDTCHVHAAGYDIVSQAGFQKTMEDFDRIVGRQYLRAWHLNDSKAPFASGRDLHANIGTGFIGLRGFWNVMNMSQWGDGVGVVGMPMVLETPVDESTFETSVDKKTGKSVTKGVEDKNVWAREIKLLESLVGMDLNSDTFNTLERDLKEQGREKREKMMAATNAKQEKDAKKEQRAKSGKGRKRKVEEDDDDVSEDDELSS